MSDGTPWTLRPYSLQYLEIKASHMKDRGGSDAVLTADTGCNYACAILKILIEQMGMPEFKVERSGQDFCVSYVLSEKKRYCFRG